MMGGGKTLVCNIYFTDPVILVGSNSSSKTLNEPDPVFRRVGSGDFLVRSGSSFKQN